MPRFESLKHAMFETRRLLRQRLRRSLASSESQGEARDRAEVSDESVLALLLDTKIEAESDEQRARATYEKAREKHPSAPEFDDLVKGGWIRVTWGRVSASFDTSRMLQRGPKDLQQALGSFLERRFQKRFIFGEAADGIEPLKATVVEMRNKPDDVHEVGCQSPDWVAARLWERSPERSDGPRARLRLWIDRWGLLGGPLFVPGTVWNSNAAAMFRDTAIEVLRSEPSFLEWAEERSRLIARVALASNRPVTEIEKRIPEVPSTVVDRYLWLENREFERVRDDLDACGDLWGLTNLLLRDVEDAEVSPFPQPIAQSLFDLALDRPELLSFLTLRARHRPVLLADMLLDPRLCALACLIVADWPLSGGAWDRELINRDDRAGQVTAFGDGIGVLGHFLASGRVSASEVAALLSWMHGKVQWGPSARGDELLDDRVFAMVRAELGYQKTEVLMAMAAGFATKMPEHGLGSPVFAAFVDLIALGGLADTVEPGPLLDAYIRSVRGGDYALLTSRIDPSGARAIVRLASHRSDEERKAFLFPFDVRARLAAVDGKENQHSVVDEIARSIRAHVRILSRAIAAWEDVPPPDLVDALISAVRTGAVAHAEKGRVAAFSASFESAMFVADRDRSIAIDLGEAMRALGGESRTRLLDAVLETDEPMMLAQLVDVAPHEAHTRIRTRIAELTPTEAGDVHSLPEIQGRIDRLLAAGALEAAAKFVEVESGLQTLGKVPGREIARLRHRLRLLFLRNDFDAIRDATLPEGLSGSEQSEAADALSFYRALAELTKPDGNLQAAEQTFAQLHQSRRDVFAYSVNLLAVRVSVALSGNLFGQLHGEQAARARQLLSEADAEVARARGITDEDRAIFACNRALLYLAIGQAERANDVLATARSVRLEDRIHAYSAVALSRMGRSGEAIKALARAKGLWGRTDILEAARAQVLRGVPLDERAGATSVDDATTRIQAALFELSRMDPSRQAAVFSNVPEALDAFTVEHVRAAAATVVSLVPMMKGMKLDSCEDDLTALVREILATRLGVVGWSLADQSKGGFSPKGNAGERDLVMRKGPATLAVLEAVVCARPVTQEWTKKELASHFQKLLGYDVCRLFFHLTYSYVDNPGAVIDELRRSAENDAPTGFEYLGREDFPLGDSSPVGFGARYRSSLGVIKVVFLLLDLAQQVQRKAAETAAKNNPRAPKEGSPSKAGDPIV